MLGGEWAGEDKARPGVGAQAGSGLGLVREMPGAPGWGSGRACASEGEYVRVLPALRGALSAMEEGVLSLGRGEFEAQNLGEPPSQPFPIANLGGRGRGGPRVSRDLRR